MQHYKIVYEEILQIADIVNELFEMEKNKKVEFIPSAEEYYKTKIMNLIGVIVPSVEMLLHSLVIAEEIYSESLTDNYFVMLLKIAKERDNKK